MGSPFQVTDLTAKFEDHGQSPINDPTFGVTDGYASNTFLKLFSPSPLLPGKIARGLYEKLFYGGFRLILGFHSLRDHRKLSFSRFMQRDESTLRLLRGITSAQILFRKSR